MSNLDYIVIIFIIIFVCFLFYLISYCSFKDKNGFLLQMIKYILVSFGIVFIFNCFFMIGKVPTSSMENTIKTNSSIFVQKNMSEPKRGDVIVFKTESMPNFFVKRVIGIENDIIDIKDGFVYLNGHKLNEEKYVVGQTNVGSNALNHFVVPKDCVFLLGDNREYSGDARFWDYPFVEKKDICGKVIANYSLDLSNKLFVKQIKSEKLQQYK